MGVFGTCSDKERENEMNDAIVAKNDMASVLESVITQGDLSKLSPEGKVFYYKQVCESIGLNPLTKPFDYINLSGKLVLYARKDATDQLRSSRGVSVYRMDKETANDVYTVTVYGKTADGRTDVSTGSVFIGGMRGDSLANAMMKAETKGKRRMTLSICGLGFLDETEVETIPDARIVPAELPGNPIPPEHDAPAPTQQATAAMTLEFAENVVTKDGKRYGDLTTEELSYHHNGCINGLKLKITPEKREDLEMKRDASATILKFRETQVTAA